jgi:hypothetical protein
MVTPYMNASETNRPVKLGWGFLALYVLIFVLLLGFFPPWKWQQRLITEVVGALLFPFLVSTAVYYTSLFVVAVAAKLPGKLRGLVSFSIELAALFIALAAVYTFPGLRNAPFYFAVGASILAGAMLKCVLRAKANTSSGPELDPIRAPAAQDPSRL